MLPPEVGLYITNHCMRRCSHCFFTLNDDLNSSELALEEIIKLLDDAHKHKVFLIRISGGDPLLHKNILEIISETKKRKILPLLGITGTNVSVSMARNLKMAGLPSIQVSLDGASETTNSFFRGENYFEETLNSIDVLQEAGLKVNLAICLDKNNYKEIDALLQLAKEHLIYKMKVQFWRKMTTSMAPIKHMELTHEEKLFVIEKCHAFEAKNRLEDWAIIPWELSEPKYPFLTISAHGGFHIGEYGPLIGHLKNELPSQAYSRFMNARIGS